MGPNDESILRIHQLGQALEGRNTTVSEIIYNSVPLLMAYPGKLSEATAERLLEIDGIEPDIADYLHRVLSGEDIGTVASDVPRSPAYRKRPGRIRRRPDESAHGGEPDGSWDDAVRYLEDRSP